MAANASSQRRRSGKQATPNTGGAKRVVTLRVPVVLDENIEAYSVSDVTKTLRTLRSERPSDVHA
jgi:hypothetical protein